MTARWSSASGRTRSNQVFSPSSTLGDSDVFKSATDALGSDFSPVALIDFVPLFQLVDSFPQAAQDPSYLQAKPYLDHLDYLILRRALGGWPRFVPHGPRPARRALAGRHRLDSQRARRDRRPLALTGLGIDLIEIERLERALERHPRLAERLFTEAELAQPRPRFRPGTHLAARFAAKEAAIKALGDAVPPARSRSRVAGARPPPAPPRTRRRAGSPSTRAGAPGVAHPLAARSPAAVVVASPPAR